MEFRAAYTMWMDKVSILVCERDYRTNKIGHIAKPMEFVMVPHTEGSFIQEPTFDLSNEQATNLMNALWQAGVRPSDFKSPNGEINRLEAHLSDMRKLVFSNEPTSTRSSDGQAR